MGNSREIEPGLQEAVEAAVESGVWFTLPSAGRGRKIDRRSSPSWGDRAASAGECVEHLRKGYTLGVVPGSAGRFVVDVDHGDWRGAVSAFGAPAFTYESSTPGNRHLVYDDAGIGEYGQFRDRTGAWSLHPQPHRGEWGHRGRYFVVPRRSLPEVLRMLAWEPLEGELCPPKWDALAIAAVAKAGRGRPPAAARAVPVTHDVLLADIGSLVEGERNIQANRLIYAFWATAGRERTETEERAERAALDRVFGAGAEPGEIDLLVTRSYGEARRTTAAAFAGIEPAPADVDIEAVRLKSLGEYRMAKASWLLHEQLPLGHLTLLAGPPGVGKSTTTYGMVASLTVPGEGIRGFPGSSEFDEPCRVVVWSGEDEIEVTIAPTVAANGGDRDRVFVPCDVRLLGGERVPFDPSRHLANLEAALTEETRLVVIDPALAVADKAKDQYSATDIRRALAPVQAMAKRKGVAVLLITHFLKRHNSTGSGVLDRILGSQAWGAVARVVWVLDEVDGEKRLVRAKNNLGPNGGGVALEFESVEGEADDWDGDWKGQRVRVARTLEGSADDLMTARGGEGDEDSELAERFLLDLLSPKGVSWKDDIVPAAKAEGIDLKDLKAVREALAKAERIHPFKEREARGRWLWRPGARPSGDWV